MQSGTPPVVGPVGQQVADVDDERPGAGRAGGHAPSGPRIYRPSMSSASRIVHAPWSVCAPIRSWPGAGSGEPASRIWPPRGGRLSPGSVGIRTGGRPSGTRHPHPECPSSTKGATSRRWPNTSKVDEWLRRAGGTASDPVTVERARLVTCPKHGALESSPCTDATKPRQANHKERLRRFREWMEETRPQYPRRETL